MATGVTVMVSWAVKPECARDFAAALAEMFETTRLRPGFRSIRLLRGETEASEFLLIEEWDEARFFQDYVAFRTERGDSDRLLAMVTERPTITTWALEPLAAAAKAPAAGLGGGSTGPASPAYGAG